jgi:LSU ribosomal protein L25P
MKVVAFERSLQGTGASRRLRRAGKTPGIIYGGEQAPQMIELDHNALYHALKKEQFHSSVLQMEIAGKSSQVLLRDYQMHPFKQLVLHIDFQRVDAGHKISMKVPLHFTGAENSPAVKLSHGLVNHVMNEVEVSCLPAELPEFIAVDLSELVCTRACTSRPQAAQGRVGAHARGGQSCGRDRQPAAGWRGRRGRRRCCCGRRRKQVNRLFPATRPPGGT